MCIAARGVNDAKMKQCERTWHQTTTQSNFAVNCCSKLVVRNVCAQVLGLEGSRARSLSKAQLTWVTDCRELYTHVAQMGKTEQKKPGKQIIANCIPLIWNHPIWSS